MAASATVKFAGAVIGVAIAGGITGGLRGAALGALSGGLFFAAGSISGHFAQGLGQEIGLAVKALGHGIAGGVNGLMYGGKFETGFSSGFFTGLFSPVVDNFDAAAMRYSTAGAIGGVSAELSGGDFEYGFVTGTFSRAFNDESHSLLERAKNSFKSWYNSDDMSTSRSLFSSAMNDLRPRNFVRNLKGAWKNFLDDPLGVAGDVAIASGPAGSSVGAVTLTGKRLGARLASLGRFFWDNRAFPVISRQYWTLRGPANGRSLHHWLFTQSMKWVPQGFRNAGFNLIQLPAFRGIFHAKLPLNQWMGFAKNWGASHAMKANMMENLIRVGIPGSVTGGGYIVYEAVSELMGDE